MSYKAVIKHFSEPMLAFRHGQRLVYPRDGLYLYGPAGDTSQLRTIRYGVIGTPSGIEHFATWSNAVRRFIDIPVPGPRSRGVEPQHVPFPGFEQAFHSEWPGPASIISSIDEANLGRTMKVANRHEAIRAAVDLFVNPIIAENNRLDHPPVFWFVVIPEFVYALGRPLSTVARSERVEGTVDVSKRRARRLESEPTLFGIEDETASVYKYAAHFRRQLKARLLKDKIVTQIVRETTLAPSAFVRDNGMPLRRLEDPASVAWKLCTGAYYKAGGKPWQLADVRPGVCYVGLVYKKTDEGADGRNACCAAQMFLSDGDGVVFRGALGPWFRTDTKQYHLDAEPAENLMRMVIGEYEHLHGRPPEELFVHAKASFSDEEWRGFATACPDRTKLVGVQISDAKDDLKLYRPGAYPVIRGTAMYVGENAAYLWTSGYVARLDTYLGPETPNPLMVRVIRGDCAIDTVLDDVMGLTKLNFNSCLHNDRFPVTLRFADAVGDVLMSAPLEGEPRLPFKHYI